MEQFNISFDEKNSLRLLDANEFEQSKKVSDQCEVLTSQIDTFQKHVDELVQLLSSQSTILENSKMLAIGQRNRIETETEMRRRKQAELQYLISQKKLELNRYKEYKESLKKMEMEQKNQLDRLRL